MSEITFEMSSRGVAIERRFPAGAALLISTMIFALLTQTSAASPIALIAAGVAAFAGAVALVQQRLYPRLAADPNKKSPGGVRVTADTLTVQRRGAPKAFPLASIAEGWFERRARGASVVLATSDGALLTIDVQSGEDAARLLAAAGVSADKQVMKTRLAPVLSRHAAMGCLVIPVSIVSTIGAVAYTIGAATQLSLAYHLSAWDNPQLFRSVATDAIFLGLLALMVIGLIPPELLIGNDGVRVRAPFRSRFVPYRDVAEVRAAGNAVELIMRDRRVVRLPVEDRFSSAAVDMNPVREAIHDRIRAAMALAGGDTRAAALSALDRAGRTFGAWRDHLAALGSSRSEYRRLALTAEDFAAVLADASSTRERRLAAAMALGSSEDTAARTRIRVAAQACADEALKRALSAAAEDELTEALAEEVTRERR